MPRSIPNISGDTLPYFSSPLLAGLDCIEHGYFGSRGGVSSGIYCSLNCGHSSRDDPACVSENRRRVADCFGLDASRLYSLKQAHTSNVVVLTPDSEAQFDTVADGMVCKVPGVGLGVLGADCAPVLFVDPHNRVIGAAHSGWKGALNGVNEAVVAAMLDLGAQPDLICAAIGPAMQQANYEVQADFRSRFEQDSPIDSSACFQWRDSRLYFDTPAYIRARLTALGIGKIEQSELDTFSCPEQFFSYRRSGARNEPDYGRQISVITLQ